MSDFEAAKCPFCGRSTDIEVHTTCQADRWWQVFCAFLSQERAYGVGEESVQMMAETVDKIIRHIGGGPYYGPRRSDNQ